MRAWYTPRAELLRSRVRVALSGGARCRRWRRGGRRRWRRRRRGGWLRGPRRATRPATVGVLESTCGTLLARRITGLTAVPGGDRWGWRRGRRCAHGHSTSNKTDGKCFDDGGMKRKVYWLLQSTHRQPHCRGRTGRRICSTVSQAHRAPLGTSLLSARPIIPASSSDALMRVQSYRRRRSRYARLDRSTHPCTATCSAGTQDTTGRCPLRQRRGRATVETATTGPRCRRVVPARASTAVALRLVGASPPACSVSPGSTL